MTISPELMSAILSLDVYNRGYNAGIEDGGSSNVDGLGESGRIGDAIILSRADVGVTNQQYDAWKAAGFYAVSYSLNGQTVISYRGTDHLLSNPWSDDVGSEIWNAYLQGLGSPLTAQAHLAADFFQAVTGTTEGDPTTANVITTGHSSGGGLAAFVAAIYRQKATVFDNMAFEGAALKA